MIRRFSIFLFISYIVIIFLAHWGTGLLLIAVILGGILFYVGKNRNWLTIFLRTLISLFYSVNHSSNVILIYTLFFFLIGSTNLIGLYIYNQHVLLTSLILVLIRLVLILWIFSYRRYLNRGWNYLANILIVNIIYPSLSLLLRNIEILTHLFRPVTLMARIWVNMWVGHCILSILSFIYIKRFSTGFGSWFTILLFPVVQGSLLLYELIITLLQSTVIVYLSFVYYRDNLRATNDQ